jgi:hypothetical protein
MVYSTAPPPPALVAAVRMAATSEGLPIVSLRSSRLDPTLKIVVRLDHPVAQLRRGALVPLVRTLGTRAGDVRWFMTAVDRRGAKLRIAGGFPSGGEAWIRSDLDGCDPSYVIVGRPAIGLFASDPRCAGDPAANPAQPVDVGGAQVGRSFPLTLAAQGLRLFALVNGKFYASKPGFYPPSPVGQAMLRANGQLVVSLGGMPVVLARSGP